MHVYLSLKTDFIVKSNPLILLDGIWYFLILNQVNTGPLKKSANLKIKVKFLILTQYIKSS